MDSSSEQLQPSQKLELEPKDPRIAKVIDELSQSARLLKDPRLLTPSSSPDQVTERIIYKSADELKYLDLWGVFFTRSNAASLPRQIKHNERIIPVGIEMYEGTTSHPTKRTYTSVWLTLDKDTPTVYQLLNGDDDNIAKHTKPITGGEMVLERPDLLSHILEAVSGKKQYFRENPTEPHLPEWRDTFDTE